MAKSDAERAREYRARKGAQPRGRLAKHGTVAAARRHQRAGTPLCESCRRAWRAHQRRMYQARKARKSTDSGGST